MNILEEFLKSRGIYVKNNKLKINYDILTNENIINYISLLGDFHKKAINPKGIILLNITNSTGNLYESYKVYLKKFKKMYSDLILMEKRNIFLDSVVRYGDSIIEAANSSLNNIDYREYSNLLKRSVKNNEVCLGNCSLGNLYIKDDLYVKDIKDISFNLFENDILFFFNKLNKKNLSIDFEKIIDCYLNKINLEQNSKDYIISMMKFPIESLKIIDRKINKKKNWNDEDAAYKLVTAINKLNI